MSRKPEKTFEQRLNRYLPSTIHHEAMGTGFSNGTPDRWYDGPSQDLWVEFKYYQTLPKKLDLISSNKLSKLQRRWLNRAYANGRSVAVIVGFVGGSVLILTDRQWENVLEKEKYMNRALSTKDAALWISNKVL